MQCNPNGCRRDGTKYMRSSEHALQINTREGQEQGKAGKSCGSNCTWQSDAHLTRIGWLESGSGLVFCGFEEWAKGRRQVRWPNRAVRSAIPAMVFHALQDTV